MGYLYEDMKNGKAGDIVERVDGLSVLKQGLYILEKDVKEISNIHILKNAGGYDGRLFKLVRTRNAENVKKGNKVICVKISPGYGADPVIGKIYEIVEDAVKGSSSINTEKLHYHDYDFKLLVEDIIGDARFNPRILRENIIINCVTKEQAIVLLNWASSFDRKWSDGQAYFSDNKWGMYGASMCYNIHSGEYCNIEHYIHHKYNVWTYEDALLDLKIDDLIEVSNDPSRKYKRHFSHFTPNGKVMAFRDGNTSKDTNDLIGWKYFDILPQG